MSKPIVLKQSPVIIIRNLIALQFIVSIIYFIAALLGNYTAIYQEFTFSQTLSYEIAKNLFIATGEGLVIAFILLRWFFTTYSIYPDLIVIEKGILFKKRVSNPLQSPVSISIHHSPLSKIFKYGTIIIKSGDLEKTYNISHLPDPENYQKMISEILLNTRPPLSSVIKEDNVEKLLQLREHEKLEFKSSLRWDNRENKVNKNLEKMVLKTIAAFLNSDGGYLIIGVNDQGQIVGLKNDYNSLTQKGADGFENHLTNVFRATIGAEFRRFIQLVFHNINEEEICLIKVSPSQKPAYTKFGDEEFFYVRTGNSTTSLQLSEATNYIRSRWQEI